MTCSSERVDLILDENVDFSFQTIFDKLTRY